ncbi:hypothetical protein DL95DRAFT_379539 [Leptodontidium sp. 2 PMI_412]|nr:hypothetical protein DL95DRAFT_379539 [Leptodontidium sp. 2 PMI_412]
MEHRVYFVFFMFSVASVIFTNSLDGNAFYNPADGSSFHSMFRWVRLVRTDSGLRLEGLEI